MVETCNIAPAAKFAAESPRLPDRLNRRGDSYPQLRFGKRPDG